MTKDSTLKLRATDEEDLAVVSTLLQDSVIAIQETAFLAGERQFVFVANINVSLLLPTAIWQITNHFH